MTPSIKYGRAAGRAVCLFASALLVLGAMAFSAPAVAAGADGACQAVAAEYEACVAAGVRAYNSAALGSGDFSYIPRCEAEHRQAVAARCPGQDQSAAAAAVFAKNANLRAEEMLDDRVHAAMAAGCQIAPDSPAGSSVPRGSLVCPQWPSGHECSGSPGQWQCAATTDEMRVLNGESVSAVAAGSSEPCRMAQDMTAEFKCAHDLPAVSAALSRLRDAEFSLSRSENGLKAEQAYDETKKYEDTAKRIYTVLRDLYKARRELQAISLVLRANGVTFAMDLAVDAATDVPEAGVANERQIAAYEQAKADYLTALEHADTRVYAALTSQTPSAATDLIKTTCVEGPCWEPARSP